MNRNVCIIGATSAIAQEVGRLYAEKGARVYLIARNREKVEQVAADLNVRGVEGVDFDVADLADSAQHAQLIDRAVGKLGRLDAVLIAYGTLPDQKKCGNDFSEAERAIRTNFTSVVSFLTHLADIMERQRNGCIAVISSVAGDRGRASNYVYGSAKGALSLYLQGLRARLAKSGVSVVTIKPGFVDTPMTVHFKKSFLYTSPRKIAPRIVCAIERKKSVVYLPGFWRPVMAILRAIPEPIFKRLNL
ncbi:MAG TPA: SDR family oxidoreductase [Bdellovibrionota bacterium]|nr:SDR family oxidoreductase [Bdellovibrionota bacterium]